MISSNFVNMVSILNDDPNEFESVLSGVIKDFEHVIIALLHGQYENHDMTGIMFEDHSVVIFVGREKDSEMISLHASDISILARAGKIKLSIPEEEDERVASEQE